MPRETEGREGIETKEHNGSNSVNNPIRPNFLLLENNPFWRTMDTVIVV